MSIWDVIQLSYKPTEQNICTSVLNETTEQNICANMFAIATGSDAKIMFWPFVQVCAKVAFILYLLNVFSDTNA